MSEEAPDLYTLMLYEQLKACSVQLKEQSDRFNAHTKAVSEFLSELYAIMVDPLADGVIPVAEMMRALKQAALRDREKWNDLDALDSAEKARLVAALETARENVKATVSRLSDSESVGDLLSMRLDSSKELA